MKKKLEADLISIAHKLLQMKDKTDVQQLYLETQKLYEKLSVLRFLEEHFDAAKPTIGNSEMVVQVKQLLENDTNSTVDKALLIEELQPVSNEEVPHEPVVNLSEDSLQPSIINGANVVTSSILNHSDQDPARDTEVSMATVLTEGNMNHTAPKESPATENIPLNTQMPQDPDLENNRAEKPQPVSISFEELLGGSYADTQFVKAEPKEILSSPIDFEIPMETKTAVKSIPQERISALENSASAKQIAAIRFGLNDRIAFIKNLFGNSEEDFNRVCNQLITYDSFEEAQGFINELVKPDYNNWEGKEEYEVRFMQIIEQKFN